jgi:glycosyltransferase involved in cell wall biosynthesis
MQLSIVIPAYNAAEFLQEAVASALAQEVAGSEIVIVDDGSTDGTGRLCRRLARRYSQIRHAEHPENRGGGATRNACVRLSRGEYIFNLDADNVLPKDLLPQLLQRAQEHQRESGVQAMVTPARNQFFHDAPRRLHLGKRRILTNVRDYERLDRDHVLTDPHSPAASGNYLFHRSIFESVGGYFEHHGPYDAWSFGLRCFLAGFPFVSVPGTHYLHRVTGVSYWQRNADSGALREYLFRAVRDLGCYEESTLQDLDPGRTDYPEDPFKCLRLRTEER